MKQNNIVVDFPLRGEWLSPNTPGSRIPSHGTDRFGTSYAYDFIQVDRHRKGLPAYRSSLFHYLFLGVPIKNYYCWGQPVYAPFHGTVLVAEDGFPEQPRTSLSGDLYHAYHNVRYFDPHRESVQTIAGNYIILKHTDPIYAALCHLQTGSVSVSVGQSVKAGDFLGRIGHSGNSLGPHLHFQLMDSSDIATAKGLPCAFTSYEVYQNGVWQKKYNAIPANKDRIRFCD